ncbi:leucine-rich repeat domain-containing protein [Clostridium butyricum]|uniref:leucine-rich repeat domain-containing protein n=2 Tax=Clostridium butyricum TaxID=1492 RepID=UPI002AAF899C|nr:leucine-rich repeat domain-containing protein [Clostridium butyricum]
MTYKKNRLLALGIITIGLSFISTNANAEIKKTEVYEETMQNEKLLANDTSIKEKTQSDYKIKRNWLTEEVASQLNKDFKDLTTEDFEHIIKIDFRYKKIDDTIPDEIALLKNLQYLDLNYCRLYGDIPEEIANMTNLTHLDLGDNKLGKLPESLEKKIIDGDYAYCDVEGNQLRLEKGWHLLKGNWTYIDRYGERLTGVQTIDKVTYDFGEQGFIKEGWEQVDNIWHYYDRVSGMIKNDWKLINSKWYYFNADGIMVTGLQNIQGTKFCFAPSGEMLTGFQNIGGYNYSFCESGGMQYGLVNVNGKQYYFDETTGIMATNTEKVINGKKYIFAADGSGSIKSNVWIDNYTYIQANGQTVNTYYDYSHSNTNYQLFKYMTDLGNQISVDRTAVALHGGITSNNCVYFASEALRRVGVGIPTSTCNTYELENELKYMGFVPCYDLSQLKPGDIVVTNNYSHVYIFMCWDTDGYAYIVDNQSYNFDNKILHKRQVYQDTSITDRATHFYYYPN